MYRETLSFLHFFFTDTIAELFLYCPTVDIRKQISLKVIQFANTVKTRKKSVFEEAQAALKEWRKSSHGDEASVSTHEESSINLHEGTVDPHEGVSVNSHEGVSGNPSGEPSVNAHLEINLCE